MLKISAFLSTFVHNFLLKDFFQKGYQKLELAKVNKS